MDDIITTWMDSSEVRAIINDSVYHDPFEWSTSIKFQKLFAVDTHNFESFLPFFELTISAGMKGKSSFCVSFEQNGYSVSFT